jgi:hypothetical protein
LINLTGSRARMPMLSLFRFGLTVTPSWMRQRSDVGRALRAIPRLRSLIAAAGQKLDSRAHVLARTALAALSGELMQVRYIS